MITNTVASTQDKPGQEQLSHYSGELMDIVRSRYPEALFRGPSYLRDEGLWVIEAFFDNGEDFDLQADLSERETDILIAHDVWLCVIPIPLSAYSNN